MPIGKKESAQMGKVSLKRRRPGMLKGPAFLLKPRVVLTPGRSFKSGKEYDRRREKEVVLEEEAA
jgi:hypothetical protein